MLLDMLGDASSNVHMQYLRDGVLMTEAEENKLHQTSFIKVNRPLAFPAVHERFQDEAEYPMLAAKDTWSESRDNLHDPPTAAVASQALVADNEVITKPRHAG